MNTATNQKKLKPVSFIPALSLPSSALKRRLYTSVILLCKGFFLKYVFKCIVFVPALTDVFVYFSLPVLWVSNFLQNLKFTSAFPPFTWMFSWGIIRSHDSSYWKSVLLGVQGLTQYCRTLSMRVPVKSSILRPDTVGDVWLHVEISEIRRSSCWKWTCPKLCWQ